ncbi:cbb3-type cytochrome c oxidase N-terminal domain-containing protein [Abyssalbus ytuae]|uniref:C-type cytochrome n=1 Tax=Abyssalbus ytuae TaxID=2926907 RepID=A0A9E7CTX5_9FLAO|nr:cbb3-type cytochrome c oxidase N-terminal domain-containing protein [Abyssalbus ytuae]UOB18911.1 c-type cytochrome [Abyssalbus ytuae]
MKDFASYLRVIIIVGLVFIAAEYFIDSGDKPAFLTYPEVSIFLILFTVTLVGIEIMVNAMNTIADALLSDEKRKELEAKKAAARENVWYRKLYKGLTKAKPIEAEGEIILDHNYDGIKELDNSLPPWWLYGFYISILFAIIYLARFHIFGGDNQAEEYDKAMAQAQIDIEEYKKTAKDLVDVNTVQLLTDAGDLAAGKTIFTTNCVACHMADGGGGIGPNLTDKYWILGGGIQNVFRTISEGGRDGKGMIAWKQSLKPSEIAQVASFVLSLQGTTPANPKEPQGDLWVDENAPDTETVPEDAPEEVPVQVNDTLSVALR